ncbi:M55 family metallopeptidase [Candidatus Sumerlaeota bacterium]|nr:M55 family metallopeptidase [Candidatus Sumerlaeota bacterium]
MRVLIMADMEGVSGIVHWDQVSRGEAMYQEGRRLYTEEINAAVRGAKNAGAKEIVVVDGHGAGAAATMGGPAFNSLIPDLLDEDCEFVTHHGWGNYLEMFEQGCDACFFVGIHSMGGTPNGVLSHTISSQHWYNITINDRVVGEIGIVAALAGSFGVPMVYVTGDDKACDEAKALLGSDLTTVAVKKGLSRHSARNIAPVRARRMVEEGAKRALLNLKKVPAFVPAKPTTVRMDIVLADLMDPYRRIPGVEIIEPRTVISRGADFLEAWKRVSPYK